MQSRCSRGTPTTRVSERPVTAGLVLAAGGGRRMGGPKAMVPHPGGGVLLDHAIAVLRDAGCAPVVVVLGADAPRAAASAAAADVVVVAENWADGQGASLRAGLEALGNSPAASVAVLLVDLPDVGADVLRRVIRAAGRPRTSLARAAYGGVPGHPVVLGRDHWASAAESATGDHGARDYLATHVHGLVECGDLATGRDVDTREDLARARAGSFRPDQR